MAEDASKQASKFVSLYNRGIITRQEAVSKLVLLAAEEVPASLAVALPPDLLGEVHECCLRPPADPSESPRILGLGVRDPQAWRRETSQAWYDGAWAWHHYFDA